MPTTEALSLAIGLSVCDRFRLVMMGKQSDLNPCRKDHHIQVVNVHFPYGEWVPAKTAAAQDLNLFHLKG